MVTQIKAAKNKRYTEQMKRIARREDISLEAIRNRVASGKIVILKNRMRDRLLPCGIGRGLNTKVNANLGTSSFRPRIKNELEKLRVAVKYGADTVMDLSIGGNLARIRTELIRHSPVPLGTVPIYETAVNAEIKYGSFLKMKPEEVLETLRQQAAEGVDFFTIHAGVTRRNLTLLRQARKRVAGIVSRGGAILACWMRKNKRENPFYEYFDAVLDIARDR